MCIVKRNTYLLEAWTNLFDNFITITAEANLVNNSFECPFILMFVWNKLLVVIPSCRHGFSYEVKKDFRFKNSKNFLIFD